jgi:cytochrome P450
MVQRRVPSAYPGIGSLMGLPPGPRLPIAVQTYLFGLRTVGFLHTCQRRYGDPFTLRLPAGRRLVMFSSPAAIREIFAAGPEQLTTGDSNAILLEPFLGSNSLLLLDGQRHLAERQLIAPAVHGDRLCAYRGLISDVTCRDMASWPVGREFLLSERTHAITFEVILRAMFDIDEDRLIPLRSAMTSLLSFATQPLLMVPALRRNLGPLTPWKRFVAVRTRVRDILVEVIRQRRADPRVVERGDILSLLITARRRDGSGLTDEELRDELLTLLLAGHETTATALSWAFDLVLHHPQVLERLSADLQRDDEAYLEAVIKEALRLRPVIPQVDRRLMRPMTIADIDLPAGVVAAPNILLTHLRPDVYQDPMVFRPERFLHCHTDPQAWLPFGGGTRRCLGAAFAMMEMRVVLRTVLTSTRLRASRPSLSRAQRRVVMLVPRDGIPVRLEESAKPT